MTGDSSGLSSQGGSIGDSSGLSSRGDSTGDSSGLSSQGGAIITGDSSGLSSQGGSGSCTSVSSQGGSIDSLGSTSPSPMIILFGLKIGLRTGLSGPKTGGFALTL